MQEAVMKVQRGPHRAWLLSLLVVCGAVLAQTEEYTPNIGQAGKDVIWVPTPDELVDRMLAMAQVTADDYVIDLGSGDGKIAIAAARDLDARSTGIEYNPDMVALAERNAREAGVAGRVNFIQGDIFEEDFSDATVVTMYLLPNLNLRLRDTILQMRAGTRVVSHAFDMGDWMADESATVGTRTAYLWIVPARVDGTWALEHPETETSTITLRQTFQILEGSAVVDGREGSLEEASLNGPELNFTLVDAGNARHLFSAMVEGDRMEGTVTGPNGQVGSFKASRSPR